MGKISETLWLLADSGEVSHIFRGFSANALGNGHCSGECESRIEFPRTEGRIDVMLTTTKRLAAPGAAIALLVTGFLSAAPARTTTAAEDFDAAAFFASTKCSMCHGAKADKHFDATQSDQVLEDAILKGIKGEKPPYMPEYGSKGVTADQAKALVAYMKSLKQ
jgi:mono/diheme cytochrome c family protein